MFRINTNVLSINGQRNLFQTSNDLSTRMERLTSGLRINNASDDAAGLTISELMRSQIAGKRSRSCKWRTVDSNSWAACCAASKS